MQHDLARPTSGLTDSAPVLTSIKYAINNSDACQQHETHQRVGQSVPGMQGHKFIAILLYITQVQV